jgi:hypothetical protein
VKCGIGENIFYDAEGLFSGSLVLFQNDRDLESGSDIFSFSMRHSEVQSLQSKSEDIFPAGNVSAFLRKTRYAFSLVFYSNRTSSIAIPAFSLA